MRKLGIYGNTENQFFLLEVFSDKTKNIRIFSRKASFADKPVNCQKNQIFLAEIRNFCYKS